MVFAKIVERRPQNSRLGLPRLRSHISGLEAGAWDVNKQAAEAEKGLLSPRPEAQEWPPGTSEGQRPWPRSGGGKPPPPGVTSEAGLAQQHLLL